MASLKRQTAEEIEMKLRQADELSATGKGQQEISRAIGVSVMTYHRWRKRQAEQPMPGSMGQSAARAIYAPDRYHDDNRSTEKDNRTIEVAARLDKLESENRRLRRLVTDLLLEKARLEEELFDPELTGKNQKKR